MFAFSHHVTFPSQICLHFPLIHRQFVLIFSSFWLLFHSFSPLFASLGLQGRQDRPKIGTRAAQEPPRSSPETPRAAQDRPKTPPRAPQDSQGLPETDLVSFWLPFAYFWLPFCLHFASFWLLFGISLGYFPAARLQHSNDIPTTFLQHSYLFVWPFHINCSFSPSNPKVGPIKGGGGISPAGRPK